MNSAVTTGGDTHSYEIYYKHKKQLFVIVGALMCAMLLSALDQMVFSTALPTIVGELDGVSHMLWVATAYILAATIGMPLYGKLSDILGRKPLLIFGIIIFIAGSIVGGLATDMPMLIAARAIQGIGGGGLMILSQSVIADVVPMKARPKYMGLIGAVFGLSSVLGPLLGGWFTEGPGWRWAFWVNIPLGIIALGIVIFFLKAPFERMKAKFDIFGTITMATAVSSLILFTSWGGTEYEWSDPIIIALIAVFAVFTGLFILAEYKATDPLIPLRLFKDRNFTIASITGLMVGIAMFGTLGYLPTYLQMVNGLSATNSGLLLLPMIAGVIVSSLISGFVVSKTGNYYWSPLVGFALIGVALVLFSTMTPDTGIFVSSIYMVIIGLGIGAVMQILVIVIQETVSHREVGVATATNNFFREIGASLGGAVVGAIFSNNLTTLLAKNLPEGAVSGGDNSITPAIVDALPQDIRDIIINAYNDALTPVFLFILPIVIIGFILLIFIKQRSASEIEAIEFGDTETGSVAAVTVIEPEENNIVENHAEPVINFGNKTENKTVKKE